MLDKLLVILSVNFSFSQFLFFFILKKENKYISKKIRHKYKYISLENIYRCAKLATVQAEKHLVKRNKLVQQKYRNVPISIFPKTWSLSFQDKIILCIVREIRIFFIIFRKKICVCNFLFYPSFFHLFFCKS